LSRDYSKLNDQKIGEELYFKRAPPRFFDGRYLSSLHQRRPISQLAVRLSPYSNDSKRAVIVIYVINWHRALPRAEARCRISLFTARLLWAEASLGAPLGRGFLLILMRVRLCYGWRLGAGSRQPLTSKINSL